MDPPSPPPSPPPAHNSSLSLLAERAWRHADNLQRMFDLALSVRGIEIFGALVQVSRAQIQRNHALKLNHSLKEINLCGKSYFIV